ncbi:5-methyltetrahydropteroyltriglutamate--homocysteine methyltransferase [Triticum aestivum]|uniref:5-methyltetrahydropteroyltriglutamate-- homocysteine methyltransferase n=1 Tax=Triticum aestivum TaxID=4565 RepID=UPI001D01C308|nr:5-methyltetrahydropteroyltriglutamate--homocysteine methyltransferase-like [Triticum aestivum]
MAQSMNPRPMKGVLSGPATILNWSFVGNDRPRFDTCYQIALTMVEDLEAGSTQLVLALCAHGSSRCGIWWLSSWSPAMVVRRLVSGTDDRVRSNDCLLGYHYLIRSLSLSLSAQRGSWIRCRRKFDPVVGEKSDRWNRLVEIG